MRKYIVYHQLLKIRKVNGEYEYGRNDLFALMIILKQLLDYDKFISLTVEIENAIRTLDYNLNTIDISVVLKVMGFPKNWKDLAGMERSVIDEKQERGA